MDVLEIATNYRNAIDSALENREFINSYFCKFPDECCDLTCDLLSQYFDEYNIKTIQVNGIHKDDHLHHHQWLLLNDSDVIIDITGDQFNKWNFIKEEIPSVHVGPEGKIHRIFCEEREVVDRTNFTDSKFYETINNQPNYRQNILINANNIISRYL